MQPKRRFWGRLVRAEGSELLRLRGTRVGEPGGESARRFRCAALVLLALLASPAVSMAAEPTPDPHPTAETPERTGTPSPDPYPSAGGAATTQAPEPAPTPAPSPSSSTPSTPAPTTSQATQPSTAGTRSSAPSTRRTAVEKPDRAQKPLRRSEPVQPAATTFPPIPDLLKRAVAAAVAAPAPTPDPNGSRMLLGGLGLLTLVLASGSLLVLLARSEGWVRRT